MSKNTRIGFLKVLGGTLGAAGLAGGTGLLASCNKVVSADGDKVKLLTSSGELVEVDRSMLTPANTPS